MPALGMAMTEALLLGWLKEPGAEVEVGEPLAEIETDKATMDLESPASGRMGVPAYRAGDVVPVGTRLVWILEGSEEEPEEPVSAPEAHSTGTPAALAGPNPDAPEDGKRKPHALSPRERRLQQEAGRGAGEGEPPNATDSGPDRTLPATPDKAGAVRRRALIASKVAESWRETPHFSVTREIPADELVEIRRDAAALAPSSTLTDLFLRAVATAFSRVEGTTNVDVGLAVDTPDGVVIPTVQRVLGRDLVSLSEARASAVARALSGRLIVEDVETEAKSTLSNLGAYGVDMFTGVIYPGQTSLVTLGRAVPRVVVHDGKPVVRTTMFATWNVDHRRYDGADAARLLAAFADALSDRSVLLPELKA